MKTILKYSFAALAMCLFARCSDSDKFSPGPNVDPNNPGVCFSSNNEKEYELDESDPKAFTLILTREKSDGALTVPIEVIKAPEGMIIPQNVSFAAGESSAELEITFPSFEINTVYPFSLAIGGGGAYANPYSSEIDGTSRFQGTFTVGSWIEVGTATVTPGNYSGSPATDFQPFEQKIYSKGSRVRIENFLLNNDGYDMEFEVSASTDIVPPPYETLGFIEGTSGSGYRWYFYKPGNGKDAAISADRIPCYLPNDVDDYITYIYFYIDPSYSYYNFRFDAENKTAVMTGYGRFAKATQGRITFTFKW